MFFVVSIRRPPTSTRTCALFPATTLFRFDVREAEVTDIWKERVRDLVPIERAAVGAPAPGAEVDLVDRDRGAGGLTVAARGHPVGVAPAPLRQADRKSTRLNSSHSCASRMPSSA